MSYCHRFIYWTQENDYGEIFTINSKATGYEGGNTSVPSLTISYPRFTNKGLYTCYARNVLGLGFSFKIHVDVKGDVPKVSVDSLNYKVPFGSSVDLNCTVTAFPNHTITFWHRNINDIITTITQDTEVPLVEVNLAYYSTVYGTAVTLHCEINSDPQLVAVYWQKITSRGFRSTISPGTVGVQGLNLTHPSLTIEFPVTSDAGEYICFAVNAIGSSGSLPTLLKVFGATPVVTVSSDSFLSNYGKELTLHCNVTSSPVHSEVIWKVKQNGVVRTITSQTSGIRGVTKDNPSLTINFVTLSDDGLYTCCATSIIGTGKSRSVRLSVDAALPYVSVVLPTYSVKEGNGVSLVCKVISSPRHTHVYWHKEKNTIISVLKEGNHRYTWGNNSRSINNIQSGTDRDSGHYTCFAINAIGVGFSRTINLEVVTISEESNEKTIIIKDDNSKILEEVNKERVKLKEGYDKKFKMVGRKMDSINFDNANVHEKNAALHKELRKMTEEIKQIETGVTEGIRMTNWNEQYSRKKNIKIHNLEERRFEQ
ncbi:unnamed protein product [Mytilus edulis]|uniref:Ig-like domain-containing protein n=1 Tax=Mytilus edulis TaxID=6550 RepID=A0A8S3RI76_MYTED|nr:unnamed protein product [Mytilus edulis]